MNFWNRMGKKGSHDDLKPHRFEVTFTQDKLGLSLQESPSGHAVVQDVDAVSEAGPSGVLPGDIVVQVQGNDTPLHEGVIAAATALGRPLTIQFERLSSHGFGKASAPQPQGSSSTAAPSSARDQPARVNPFKKAQEAARQKLAAAGSRTSQPALTEEQKRERREAALRAAEERGKSWDKRLEKARKATAESDKTSAYSNGNAPVGQETSEETRRRVEACRLQEQATAQQLGYNPYEVKMSGHHEGRRAAGGVIGAGSEGAPPSPPRTSLNQSPAVGGVLPDLAREEEQWEGQWSELEADMDEALGQIFSQDGETALIAVQTMSKMLSNMANNSSEDKFKRIRLGNATFQNKVGCVAGGIEALQAAGFQLHSDEAEAYLQYGPCDPMPLALQVALDKLQQAEALLRSQMES